MTNCEKCGALMVQSSRTGKWYCSAKCWLPEEERNKTQSSVTKPQNQAVSNQSVILNKTENADSIEWRLSTGKSVKVYCDADKPAEAEEKLRRLVAILEKMDIEHPEVEKH